MISSRDSPHLATTLGSSLLEHADGSMVSFPSPAFVSVQRLPRNVRSDQVQPMYPFVQRTTHGLQPVHVDMSAAHNGWSCTRHHQQDSLEKAQCCPLQDSDEAQGGERAHAGAGTSCMLQPTCNRHRRAPAAPFQPTNSEIAREARSARALCSSAIPEDRGRKSEFFEVWAGLSKLPKFWADRPRSPVS